MKFILQKSQFNFFRKFDDFALRISAHEKYYHYPYVWWVIYYYGELVLGQHSGQVF